MPIKVNSFILSDKLVNRMKGEFRVSNNIQREKGFNLCQKKNGDIIDRNDCTGSSCEIDLYKYKCPKDEKLLGGFHTHPADAPIASPPDLSNAYFFELSCIAGLSEGGAEINCLMRKGEYNEKYHKEIYDEAIKFKSIPTWERSYVETRRKSEELTNKYFNVAKVAKIKGRFKEPI